MDNAAPTVLDTSQLPTRQIKRKTPSQRGPSDKLASVLSQRPQYLSSPFCDIPWSDDTDGDGSGSGSGSDEYTAEPIDEQEIFGENRLIYAVPLALALSLFPLPPSPTPILCRIIISLSQFRTRGLYRPVGSYPDYAGACGCSPVALAASYPTRTMAHDTSG